VVARVLLCSLGTLVVAYRLALLSSHLQIGPHSGQHHSVLFFASFFRSSALQSRAPMAPSPGVGKKEMRASRMRRIPQAGCQDSGW